MRELSIGEAAQLATWREIREDSRRRFAFCLTMGFFQLFASLIAGAYLFASLAQLEVQIPDFVGFSQELSPVRYFAQFARLYVFIAGAIVLVFVFLMLVVLTRLPAIFSAITFGLPGIGSIWRVLTMSEFCQSIYGSVVQQKTYSDALETAARDVSDKATSLWSTQSSRRVAHGEPIEQVLRESPIQDQPLPIVASILPSLKTAIESTQLWHQASSECHLLLQSRVNRTLRLLSIFSLTASVLIAGLAIFLPILSIAGFLESLRGSFLFYL
jgi:type II secretory pathway component PulF